VGLGFELRASHLQSGHSAICVLCPPKRDSIATEYGEMDVRIYQPVCLAAYSVVGNTVTNTLEFFPSEGADYKVEFP
jgi:hypothetical protein